MKKHKQIQDNKIKEAEEKIKKMDDKFQCQLKNMKNELKQDMSALKTDIKKNNNMMVSTMLEATTTMMKCETAEMKNTFSMLMAQMAGLTSGQNTPTQVTPSKDLSRDQKINIAVSPDHQAKVGVSH
eukprot:7539519-Ditylum_brightwellii.AAC.1